jgi:hypothetical protein
VLTSSPQQVQQIVGVESWNTLSNTALRRRMKLVMTGIDGRERAASAMPARFHQWARWVAVGVICFHACLLPWELYRRIWQVLRADLVVSTDVLTPGATISIDIVTSGEVRNRIVVELEQDTRREILLEFHGDLNRMNVYDVRTYRYSQTITLTSSVLTGFKPGPAVVTLTGYGGMKLLRTPPPVVRQQPVMLSVASHATGTRQN